MTGRDASTPDGWLSYDSVADIYERVAVPWFGALAFDLVATVELRPDERVLDVGTGTGLAARTAQKTCPGLSVVGVDPSRGMLARLPPGVLGVAGVVPGLPFAPASFDAAVANLSMSHSPDLEGGVADIARVIRTGGRFACTAWAEAEANGPGNQRARANAIVAAVHADLGMVVDPPDQAVPWEQRLKDPRGLEAALLRGGLDDVRISPHRSAWSFTVDGFLSGWGSNSRYLRHAFGESAWRRFVDKASVALRRELGERIEITNVAWIATARRC